MRAVLFDLELCNCVNTIFKINEIHVKIWIKADERDTFERCANMKDYLAD